VRTEAEIEFSLDRAQRIDVAIHDAQGREIARLAQGVFPAGPHRMVWDGRLDNSSQSPSGVYFLRMRTEDGSELTRALVWVR
jgi:hypothetical protein